VIGWKRVEDAASSEAKQIAVFGWHNLACERGQTSFDSLSDSARESMASGLRELVSHEGRAVLDKHMWKA
jgi:hypothetical protein